jgi:hypothetical protein
MATGAAGLDTSKTLPRHFLIEANGERRRRQVSGLRGRETTGLNWERFVANAVVDGVVRLPMRQLPPPSRRRRHDGDPVLQ